MVKSLNSSANFCIFIQELGCSSRQKIKHGGQAVLQKSSGVSCRLRPHSIWDLFFWKFFHWGCSSVWESDSFATNRSGVRSSSAPHLQISIQNFCQALYNFTVDNPARSGRKQQPPLKSVIQQAWHFYFLRYVLRLYPCKQMWRIIVHRSNERP